MNRALFYLVSNTLNYISKLTGRAYTEINIIVYYILVPASWCLLMDVIFNFHYFTIAFLCFCAGFFTRQQNFRAFSDKLFIKSVDFLNSFNTLGSNYINSSVWICVFAPIFIYSILFFFALK